MNHKQTRKKRRRGSILFRALLVALLMGVYARFVEPEILIIRKLTLPAQNLKADCRIVFFTDTHFDRDKPVSDAVRLAEKINELEPDLVIFGGDLLDNYSRDQKQLDLEMLRTQLNSIEAPGGKYAVWGNHDWGGGAVRIYQEFMESCGFQVLKNETLILEKYQIQLLGYDDYLTGDLEQQTDAFSEEMFPLLVAHEPVTAHLLAKLPQGGLMLTGHTHGGQTGLPWIRKQILPPGSGNHVRGLYSLGEEENAFRLYVSSGIGTTRLPLRLLAPPEIVCIDLKKNS